MAENRPADGREPPRPAQPPPAPPADDEDVLDRYARGAYDSGDAAFMQLLHAVHRRRRAREFARRREEEAGRARPQTAAVSARSLEGRSLPELKVRIGRPIFSKSDPSKAAIFEVAPLSDGAPLPAVPGSSSARLVVKAIPHVRPGAKEGVDREMAFQMEAHALGLSPAVLGVLHADDPAFSFILMERVDGSSLADLDEESVDAEHFVDNYPAEAEQVRAALRKLATARIFYPDRTAFNFMRVTGRAGSLAASPLPQIVVIDFEHATREDPALCRIEAEAEPIWNEDFA